MISNGHRSGWIRYFLPSFAQMFFLIVFVGIYSGGADSILKDGDTGYHIRAGEIIMREMAVRQNDPFSFISPPLPWTAHEWLSEVVMALAHKAVGLAGVVFLFALLLSVTYWVLFRAIRTFRRNILVDLLVIILVVSSSQIHWLARPHAFSLLLTVLLYYVLILHQEDRGYYLYLIPPMMLLWVNLHGGFIAGFLFLAIFLTGYFVQYFFSSEKEERPFSAKKGKQLFMVSAVSFLAACVNPYGFHAFLFPFRLVSDTYLMDNVSEFLSPNFHGFLPYRYLLLSLIGILGFSRVALSVTESILVLLFTSMSLYSVRYIPLCAIVYAPILSKYGDILLGQSKGKVVRWLRTRTEVYETIDAGAKGYAILIAAMAVFTVLSATGKVSARFPEKMAPMNAIDFLRKNPIQGNMFNNDEIGDYVIYGLYPQYKVFVDGRLDMYGTPIIKEYKKVVAIEPGWRDVLDKYNINYIFFYTDSVLVRHLLTDAGWKGIYSDNVASIFLRNIPENAEIIARYSPGGTVPGKGH